MSTSQKEYLGNGNPDGTSLGRAVTEPVGVYGVVTAQQAHIADATDAATAITTINAVIVALETFGITATA